MYLDSKNDITDNDQNRLVSVIVPVYNGTSYVVDLIQSFLRQSYQSFEMILIDDGSTDDSLAVLESYQKKHPENIFVYTQENQGIAKTRNRGIREAKGFYVMFADNDDYVQPDYIETLVNEIEHQKADMVICSCRKVDPDGKTLYEQVLTQDEWAKFRMITPWARIIRRDFIIQNNLEFGDFKIGEDIYFTVTAYNMSEKIATVPYIGYNWVQRSTSVSNTTQKNKITSPFPMLDALVKRNERFFHVSREMFMYFIIKMLVWNLYYVCDTMDTKTMRQYCDEYFKWLDDKFPDYRSNKLVSFGKPKGEDFGIRALVTVFVKMSWLRIPILKAIKFAGRFVRLK